MTTTWTVGGDAEGQPTDRTCAHLGEATYVARPEEMVCPDCIREGTQWVHLRQCLDCGHVGCCDNSPRRHATAHWHTSQHALMRSLQPDEDWGWCFADSLFVLPG